MLRKNGVLSFCTVLFLILYFNCVNQKKKNTLQIDNYNSNEVKDSIYKGFYLDIILEDTLILGKSHMASIKIYHPLLDSLKIGQNDEKFLLSYYNFFNENYSLDKLKKSECDTVYVITDKINDTIKFSFSVTPKSKGNKYFGIILEEEIYLKEYHADSLFRFLQGSYKLQKNVFVRDNY